MISNEEVPLSSLTAPSDLSLPISLPQQPTKVTPLAAETDRRGQTPSQGLEPPSLGAPCALGTTFHAAFPALQTLVRTLGRQRLLKQYSPRLVWSLASGEFGLWALLLPMVY